MFPISVALLLWDLGPFPLTHSGRALGILGRLESDKPGNVLGTVPGTGREVCACQFPSLLLLMQSRKLGNGYLRMRWR